MTFSGILMGGEGFVVALKVAEESHEGPFFHSANHLSCRLKSAAFSGTCMSWKPYQMSVGDCGDL